MIYNVEYLSGRQYSSFMQSRNRIGRDDASGGTREEDGCARKGCLEVSGQSTAAGRYRDHTNNAQRRGDNGMHRVAPCSCRLMIE